MSYEDYDYQITRKSQAGHSLIDLLIALTLIGIVLSVAMVRIGTARDGLRLTNSAHVLSAYLEKARMAAIRCHCSTTIQISSIGSYSITGPLRSATVETITYPLEPTVKFQGLTLPLTITFDWRGRAGTTILLTLTDSTTGVGSTTVVVGQAGDISTDTTVTGPVIVPTPQTTVTTTAGIKSMH